MRLNFDEIAAFKVGDVFYECEAGMNIEARCTSAPVESKMESEDRRQLSWSAENTQTGEAISYLVTDGLMHYGPHIYSQPEYGRIVDGAWVTPLLGQVA
jgi:hypothetical protein